MQTTRGATHRLVPKCPQTSLLDLTEFSPVPNMWPLGTSCTSALSTSPPCKLLVTVEATPKHRLVWAACPKPQAAAATEASPVLLTSQP